MDARHRLHCVNFIRKFTSNSIFFLIPLHFLQIGLPGWQIGLIMAFYASAPLLFSFPAGWINDRFSIKKLIQAGLVTMSLTLFLIGRAKHFLPMLFLFLMLGIANNALDVSINNFFYKDGRDANQNKKYGLLAFWLALGVAAGTFFGGFLTTYARFEVLLNVYAFLMLAPFFLVFPIGEGKKAMVSLQAYRLGILNRKTLAFSVMILVLTLHWGAEGTVYSPFLKEHFGLSHLQLSLYISIPLFLMALSAFLFSFLKYDLRKNNRLFLLAMFLSGLGLIMMVNNNLVVSFAFRILHEIGDGFIGAALALTISRLFSKDSIGGSSGILLMIMTSGHMIGSLVFSSLGFGAGLHWPFIVAGGLLILNAFYGRYVFKWERY